MFLVIATCAYERRGRDPSLRPIKRSLIKRGGILSTQAPDFKRTPKADAAR